MKKKLTRTIVLIMILSLFTGHVVPANEDFDISRVNEIMRDTSIEELQATSAILMDVETGKILYEHNIDQRLPMASITKVMTTMIVMERIKEGKLGFEDQVSVSEYAYSFGGSQVYLVPGEVFTLREMIAAIEIHSANDAAVAVAEHVAGTHDAFVSMMNMKAAELGMADTRYTDSTGLDDESYSTTRDLAVLARTLVTVHPEILEFTSKIYDVFRPGGNSIDMYNRNRLITFYPGATGLKTGFTTRAGYCLAGTAQRGDFGLVAIVLGCPDTNTRFAETAKLLDYGYLNFEVVRIEEKGIIADTLKVDKGVGLEMDIYIKEDSEFLMNRQDAKKIERVVDLPDKLTAPFEKDLAVGKVSYLLDGEVLGTVDLLTADGMLKAGFFTLLWRTIKSWFGIK
ncbi:MAG: D-alanyl-D-alanine carboxypeptidase family protein [Clostridia bacterium]